LWIFFYFILFLFCLLGLLTALGLLTGLGFMFLQFLFRVEQLTTD